MSNKPISSNSKILVSTWENYQMSSDGKSDDIKKSAAIIREEVRKERKILSAASIFNGGTGNDEKK